MLAATGRLPDVAIACVGGGSNAIGLFHAVRRRCVGVSLLGFEAGGRGSGLGENAASLSLRPPRRAARLLLAAAAGRDGQVQETHSVSAGLDYPGVGPEHALLALAGRVRYEAIGDDEALAALPSAARPKASCRRSSPRTRSRARSAGRGSNPGQQILIGLSGRGDKDMPTLQRTLLAGGATATA